MSQARRYPWEDHDAKLVVETPEQTRVEYRIASFGARIAAAMLDTLILLLATIALALFGGLALGWFGGNVGLLILAGFPLLSTLYFALLEATSSGKTPGKRALKLRTMMATGHGVTIGAALIRNFARLVDNFPVFWVVPAMTKGSRRIGDLLAGTVVIDENPRRKTDRGSWLTRLAPSWREIPDRRFSFTGRHAEALHVDDLNLIEYIETRLASIPARKRREALAAIAAKYVDRLDLEEQRSLVEEDPQRFLQELGLFLRSRFDDQVF